MTVFLFLIYFAVPGVHTVYAFLRMNFYLAAALKVYWPFATIFKFKQNSFYLHVLTYIVLSSSPFIVHYCQIYFLGILI